MEAVTIVSGIGLAVASGLAIGGGIRLFPIAAQSIRDARRCSQSRDGLLEKERLLQLQVQRKARKLSGRTRESSIVGLYKDVLRHRWLIYAGL